MIFSDDERKTVRECNLEWHCHEVSISQIELDDGYEFKGYGTIKSHENGSLYLDFICLEANKRMDFITPIPEDSLDPKQSFTMNAISINGIGILSKGLRIDTDFQSSLSSDPTFYRIGLPCIEIVESSDVEEADNKYLQLEFNEKCRAPTNKSNKTESTLGTSSFSWNQTVLNYLGGKINIIYHEKFTEVYANGSQYNLEVLRDAIVFYLGFSSGKYIQPYFEYRKDSESEMTIINSIDKRKINVRIPAPISDTVHDQNNKPLDQDHFYLFYKIYESLEDNPKVFESVYSQWKRVWHSFLSSDLSVRMLTIPVAVEGVLNDIFIPAITDSLKDEDFEVEKEAISLAVGGLDDISKVHIESIKKFIGRWGNIHPKKALEHLESVKIIEKRQIKNWSELRNSSAHPKLMKQDEERKRKDINRTIICLGLFYRLILNVFSYKGAQYAFEKPKDSNLVIYEYINILH
jgi:hypothetical protein